MNYRSAGVGLVVALVALSACVRDTIESTPVTTQATTTAAPTTTSTTVATTMPPTTLAPTTAPTTTAPTTTAAPATTAPTTSTTTTTTTTTLPVEFTLRERGLGPFDFGTAGTAIADALSAAVGTPSYLEDQEYPIGQDGQWLDEYEEIAFSDAFGREVCYPNALCIFLGGPSYDDLRFRGWILTDGAPSGLSTADGLSVGRRWAEYPAINFDLGFACYTYNDGVYNGMLVGGVTTGEVPWIGTDDDGNWIEYEPDPADVEIVRLEAGQTPVFLFADC